MKKIDILKFAIVLFIPTFIFLVLKAYSKVPYVGDENIYFYAGWATLRGVRPFAEMPFAHPPLHLLLAILWMIPDSVNPIWLKMSSVLPATLTLICVMCFLRYCSVSLVVTLITGLFVAFSYEFLIISTHFTGANWSMLFLMLGLCFCLYNGRSKWIAPFAGICLAAATLVALHTCPMAICIALCSIFFREKNRFRVVTAFVLFFVFVHLAFWICFGHGYSDQLFSYHANKTPMPDRGLHSILDFVYNSYVILSFAGLGLIILLRDVMLYKFIYKGFVPAGELFIAAFAIIVQFCAVGINSRVYTYYMAPTIPFGALLLALALERGRLAIFSLFEKETCSRRNLSSVVAGLFFSILILATCFMQGEEIKKSMAGYRMRQRVNYTYRFDESPFLNKTFNSLVKKYFFVEVRNGSKIYTGPTTYLWHEFGSASPEGLVPEILKYKDYDGTIFGDASIAPYLALVSGRHIALEMPDTNGQLLNSGIVKMDDLLARLKENMPRFMVTTPGVGISGHPDFINFFRREGYQILGRSRNGGSEMFLYGKLN